MTATQYRLEDGKQYPSIGEVLIDQRVAWRDGDGEWSDHPAYAQPMHEGRQLDRPPRVQPVLHELSGVVNYTLSDDQMRPASPGL